MDQLAPLLNKLAEQMGTTSQYLWGVLLKQAPVKASIIGAEYAITAIALYMIFRFRKSIVDYCAEELPKPVNVIGGVVIGIIAVVWLLECMFCFESFLTAIFNPEYWAMQRVLSAVKK